MTDLKTLMEAIGRYEKPRYPDHEEWQIDACIIADAFTNREPITAEKLEALGFKDSTNNIGPRFTLSLVKFWVVIWQDRIWRSNYLIRGDEVPKVVFPPPQTMGDVAYLLFRLTRQESP